MVSAVDDVMVAGRENFESRISFAVAKSLSRSRQHIGKEYYCPHIERNIIVNLDEEVTYRLHAGHEFRLCTRCGLIEYIPAVLIGHFPAKFEPVLPIASERLEGNTNFLLTLKTMDTIIVFSHCNPANNMYCFVHHKLAGESIEIFGAVR